MFVNGCHALFQPADAQEELPMDFHNSAPIETLAFGEALDQAAIEFADDLSDGLSVAVQNALQDPLVKAIMAADKVDRGALSDVLRRVSATLANPPQRPCCHC
jgi:thiamine monophosphate kinase